MSYGGQAKLEQNVGYENAVAMAANTPVATPGVCEMVNCTVAGNIVLVTKGGQTVTLAVQVGTTTIPLACTQMNTSTFTGTAYNCY
jgi:hypothetical protein